MYDFKKIEEEILKFWEKDKTYEKSKKKNVKGKKFYFLQGPPYTSGKIHIGHAWNNSLKDVILKYKRMKGFNVWARGGYDMHGLPTENAVQKKLGLKTKDEIEKIGVEKFIKECMKFSIEHMNYMNNDFWKLGVWLDHKNAYKPIEKNFISGEWAFFKKAWEQKRLYKGMKVMHWDAETETSLAKHELEYKNIKDNSIYVAFKLKNQEGSLIIWTTTPWTLPFNLAIMVNPDINYVKTKIGKEIYYIAKDLLKEFEKIIGKKTSIIQTIKGKNMEDWKYETPFYPELKKQYDSLKKKYKKIHSVILNKEFVTTETGTGLVHCAPGCGPEDQEAAKPYNIGVFNTLNEQGKFENMGKYSGWKAKVYDEKFIQELEKKKVLLEKKTIEHEYPHSWRSHKPVIFRTTEQWFLKTEDMIKDLLKFNKSVFWQPEKSGRSYMLWTKNLKDNGVTRQRFWGCPVPIWINEKNPEDYIVLGSVEELEKLTKKKFNDLNLHKPWIDKIVIKKSNKIYKRIPDVADVWIDSGTASWNCLHNNPKLIKKFFPADLILEATEQTRLWFSLLQICSKIMFDKSCYKNVYTHGMILDYQGTKMSKSLGNIISPYEVLEKYGADVLRYYMCQINAGENINFSWEDIKLKQRNLNVLINIVNYMLDLKKSTKSNIKQDLEEKFIFSRKNSTIKKITELLEDYRIDEIIKEIENLYLDLSRVYIKLTRNKANSKDAGKVLFTIENVLTDILKIFSIICPFITEHLWKKLGNKKSIHLSSWPKSDVKLINKKLETEFKILLEIIEKGLAERDKIKIGLKWPLAEAELSNNYKVNKYLEEIIKTQLNIKNIKWKKVKSQNDVGIKFNTTLTPELEAEGYAREMSRQIQAFRKKLRLEKNNKINLIIETNQILVDILKKQELFLKQRTNTKNLKFVTTEEEVGREKFKNKTNFEIRDKRGMIWISLIK